MKNLSLKEMRALEIASKYKKLAISFGYNKRMEFIPIFGNQISPALLQAFSYADSIVDFVNWCKKMRYEINPEWKELAFSGKLDLLVYGD